MNTMNIQGQSQKYGHLIAVGGMVIALISFFFFPFVTMSIKDVSSQATTSSYTYTALQAAAIQGFVWLDALLAGGILLVALLLAYSRNPFGMSNLSLDRQIQRGAYILIGVSAASLLLQYIIATSIPGSLVGMFSSLFSSAGSASSAIQSALNSISVSYTTGSWFYLVGMLIAIGGEIYALTMARPGIAPPVQYQGAPSWQQPNQPPMPQQYPPQQMWQPPQPPTEYR